jgi:hypothetical protein
MGKKVTAADERASFGAYEAITATLQRYIDGARAGDSTLMRGAFLETASVRRTYDSKPVEWTLREFCDLIDKAGPAVALAAKIVQIDHAGTAGVARLEAADWRGTRYTDFFVRLKVGADWRITSKVFFAHSRA